MGQDKSSIQDIISLVVKERPGQGLQETLESIRGIVDVISQPLLILDDSLKLVSANEYFYTYFNETPSQVLDTSFFEICGGAWNSPEVRELLANAVSDHVSFKEIEIERFFPGTGILTMLLNISPLSGSVERNQYIILAIRDITGRRQAQRELSLTEMKYRRLFESAQDGMMIVDSDTGAIEEVNPVLLKMIGFSKPEVLGRKFWELGLTEDTDKYLAHFNTLRQERTIRFEDVPLQAKDGHRTEVEFACNVFETNNQQEIHCNIRDISQRKQVEQLKDEFLSMVSHELSRPLTIITGSLNTVLDSSVALSENEKRHLLKNASLQSDALTQLLGNLLELARVQAERLFLHIEPMDIKIIIDSTIERISEQYPAYRYIMDVPDDLPPINVDSVRLERVLYNLMDNACKYSSPGSEVRLFAARAGNEITLGVSDQGKGIPVSEHEKIFGAFQRVEQIGFKETKGTGLGLMVCRRLIEAHGGKIWFESESGQGSTFFFTIPISRTK